MNRWLLHAHPSAHRPGTPCLPPSACPVYPPWLPAPGWLLTHLTGVLSKCDVLCALSSPTASASARCLFLPGALSACCPVRLLRGVWVYLTSCDGPASPRRCYMFFNISGTVSSDMKPNPAHMQCFTARVGSNTAGLDITRCSTYDEALLLIPN